MLVCISYCQVGAVLSQIGILNDSRKVWLGTAFSLLCTMYKCMEPQLWIDDAHLNEYPGMHVKSEISFE